MSRSANLFITLIRTHHITSRKKLQRVKRAARQLAIPFVLVRSGGSPGIMYAEGPDESGVAGWVNVVKSLRYKDFQCAQKPISHPVNVDKQIKDAGFNEVASVTEFSEVMQRKGLTAWWEVGMGYKAKG
ncbi:hypothetical protein DL769_004374 [Monosporascus sp. CRB-8-3]|nr:hypothetical protein DL769_004374 [Monosporascus sp. CRB-8-3]